MRINKPLPFAQTDTMNSHNDWPKFTLYKPIDNTTILTYPDRELLEAHKGFIFCTRIRITDVAYRCPPRTAAPNLMSISVIDAQLSVELVAPRCPLAPLDNYFLRIPIRLKVLFIGIFQLYTLGGGVYWFNAMSWNKCIS